MPTIGSYASNLSLINQLNLNSNAYAKNVNHIATGQMVNSPGDNPALYSIVEQMKAEIQALQQADSNTQTGTAMLNVASGAMDNTMEILTTLKEKAIAASNSTMKDSDRATMQKEFNQYLDQINDNSLVSYNGINIMDGSRTSATKQTQQAYTNTSLGKETTADTKLVDLTNRVGDNLNIAATDTVTVSYVKDGKTYSTSYSAADTKVSDIFTNANQNAGGGNVFDVGADKIGSTAVIGTDEFGNEKTTASGENAITVRSATAGKEGMIAGFTITVTDSQGNEKKSVNNALNAFNESIVAADTRGDNALRLQTGTEAGQNMSVSIGDVSARGLGLQGSDGRYLSIGTQGDAQAAINVIDNAINRLLDNQTTVGAYTSRLEYTHKNITTQTENLYGAKSTMIDTDMAKEITALTTNNMLMQATQSMLAQGMQNATWFLGLLR